MANQAFSFESSHVLTGDGVDEVSYGTSYGIGFTIAWEDPRVASLEQRTGALEVDVLDALIDRFSVYQNDKDLRDNPEISQALSYLRKALAVLTEDEPDDREPKQLSLALEEAGLFDDEDDE